MDDKKVTLSVDEPRGRPSFELRAFGERVFLFVVGALAGAFFSGLVAWQVGASSRGQFVSAISGGLFLGVVTAANHRAARWAMGKLADFF